MANIHPTSFITPGARLGLEVEIGPFTIVHSNVIIGNRTKIGGYCELGLPTPLGSGSPLEIGADSLIRSHSVFYESSIFGDGLITGHHVIVRENTIAGLAFQIGTQSEIQGDCKIGNHVRFQSNVFVGKKTTIGNFVWVLPYAVFTNDPTPPSNDLIGCVIQDFAVISAMALILPGVIVGQGALVAAHACVSKDVPKNMAVAGVPAKIIGETKSIKKRDNSGQSAYPWTMHFHRGYPEEVIEIWCANSGRIDQ
jgi:acetyltransferase-like isoleucine patch superfamily enzyme